MPNRSEQDLHEILGGLTGDIKEVGGKERWSLSDIDRLLESVTPGAFVPKPVTVLEPEPETEEFAEEIAEEELQEEAAEEELLEDILEEEEIPEDEPQEDDLPENNLLEEETAVFEKLDKPVQDEVSSILTPDEIGPAPESDSMRFDLFQTRDIRHIGAEGVSPPVVHGLPQIEKPGVVVKRVDMQMTTDLSPVPRIVPADELLRKAPAAEVPVPDIPEGQQRLPGFEEQAEAQPMSDEEFRLRLEKSKEQRTSQFTSLRDLTEKMEEHGEIGTSADEHEQPAQPSKKAGAQSAQFEYEKPEERDSTFRLLRQARGRHAITAMTVSVFAVTAIVLQGVSLLSGTEEYSLGMSFVHALLLLAGLLTLGNDLLSGVKALFRRAPNADTALLFAGLVSAVQVVLLLLPSDQPRTIVPCAALFLFQGTVHAAARWMQARQRCDNFRFAAYTNKDNLYAVRMMNSHSARSAAMDTESVIAVPVPVQFPGHFVRESLRPSAVDQTCVWLLPLSLGLAVLVGACAGAMGESVAAGFSAGAIAMCLCMPAANLLTLTGLMRNQQKGQENGIAILNTEAAEHCAGAEAFVLDSADLYLHPKGRMHGWREYWQVRTDEVLLYAAAIAIASGGPLQAVFEGVVEGDYAVLPDVKELKYEDRMGLTCWIHNQMVFFGNRKLLENHGITVALTEKEERAYEYGGRKIVYMAMEKRLTAFFVVSYMADPALTPAMQLLEKEDIQARICNSDPCITQENVSAAFDLREGSVKLLRAAPSEALRRQMRVPANIETAGIYHANNARAFLRAFTACAALRTGIKRLRAFQIVGVLTSFLLLLIFALGKQMDAANDLIFIGCTLIWTAFTYTFAARN